MPNHKSAEKRMRQSIQRRDRNRKVKSQIKNRVRDVRDALDQGNLEAAQQALPQAVSQIASAATKGVIPKRRADRKISRLTRAVNGEGAEGAEA